MFIQFNYPYTSLSLFYPLYDFIFSEQDNSVATALEARKSWMKKKIKIHASVQRRSLPDHACRCFKILELLQKILKVKIIQQNVIASNVGFTTS